ncbi:hypothetical protein [Enterococcus faecium]|uniref:hypothetical protein n=1 Tax=Enterococcus faecium TaxID=1352 RepID=UPI0023B2243C|nr:hypothetical protein [Enterococcus faecium]
MKVKQLLEFMSDETGFYVRTEEMTHAYYSDYDQTLGLYHDQTIQSISATGEDMIYLVLYEE